MHKVIVALVVLFCQSAILIKINSCYLGKIDIILMIPLYQLIINSDWC